MTERICPACKKPFLACSHAKKYCRRRRCILKRKRESAQRYRSTTIKPYSNQLLKEQLVAARSKNRLEAEPALAKLRNLSGDKFVREVNGMLRRG